MSDTVWDVEDTALESGGVVVEDGALLSGAVGDELGASLSGAVGDEPGKSLSGEADGELGLSYEASVSDGAGVSASGVKVAQPERMAKVKAIAPMNVPIFFIATSPLITLLSSFFVHHPTVPSGFRCGV
jgi:hypothetical protein